MSALTFLLLLSADLFSLLDYIRFINFIVWRKNLRPSQKNQKHNQAHRKYTVIPPTHTHTFQVSSLESSEAPLYEGWRHCHWELN